MAKKWGTKKARNNFPRNNRIVRAKNVGKKSSVKCAKKRFLYSHEYRGKKMGGGKCAKQIFQKHMNSATKKCWEKIVGKKCDKSFFIFTRISCSKKGDKKMRETIFPETHK